MKTPVLIPAFNEASRIEKTLLSLPSDIVEPIVIINGSTDNTAELAEKLGATILYSSEQGKMPALQMAINQLGQRALDPLLVLDADTSPLFPHAWHNRMIKQLTSENGGVIVGGALIITSESLTESLAHTLYRAGSAIQERRPIDTFHQTAIQFGANIGLKIATSKILDAVMDISHFWPGEDQAIAQTFIDNDGIFIQTVDPLTLAFTPVSPSAVTVKERLQNGAEASIEIAHERYAKRAAPGSFPYNNGHF